MGGTGPEATNASGVGRSGASGAQNKRKHSVATEDEETDIEMEGQEPGASPLTEGGSGGVARGDDSGGRTSESGSVKGGGRGKKKGAGGIGNGSGDGGAVNHASHGVSSKISRQEKEEDGGGGCGKRGNKEGNEHSVVKGLENFRGGAAKHKKSKKARKEKQQPGVDISFGGNGDGGDGRAEDSNTQGSVYAHRYEPGRGAVDLSLPDSLGLGATVVAEGGGHGGDGEDEDHHDGVDPDWGSPTSHGGAAPLSPNVGQEVAALPPPARPQQQQEQQQQQQQQPKRMTVSEEEESTEEEEEAVPAVDGRHGHAATYHAGAAKPASPTPHSLGATSRGASSEANVVPVLHPPSSAPPPDPTTLSVAQVLVSRLRMLD